MPYEAFATVEGIIVDDPGIFGVELDIAARKALAEIVNDVIIPEAAENAPGSIGPKIAMGRVERIGVGTYAVDITVPKEYLATEHGSGVFIGDDEYTFGSKDPGGVLLTESGLYIKKATQIGQPAQHYIHNAVQAHLKDVAGSIFKELRHGLNSRVTNGD